MKKSLPTQDRMIGWLDGWMIQNYEFPFSNFLNMEHIAGVDKNTQKKNILTYPPCSMVDIF